VPAQVTPEGLLGVLAGVGPLVAVQIALVRAAEGAQVTLEGLLAAVGPLVDDQLALPRTLVPAQVAGKAGCSAPCEALSVSLRPFCG
jgi:hypothetical protein